MPSRSLKTIALVSATAAATSIVIQACGGGAIAQTSDADVIEGAWDSSVTIKDCTSGAPQASFKGASLFHRGGTLSGDNSMPPTSRGAAFGIWKHGAGSSYTANLFFTRYNPDGTVAGTQKVSRSLTLGGDGNSFSGTLTLQVFNPAGAVVANGCGAETGTRVTW